MLEMENALTWLAAAAAGYLAGAVPFGYLIGKARGVDVRTVGSKNIGATNVYRTVGKKWGLLAFFCDFLKGLLPTLAAKWWAAGHAGLAGAEYLPAATGVACVAGHMWTCFMKFKGGKGIATGFGMMVGLVPWLVLTAFGIFAAAVWITHYISVGSILAAAFMLVTVWFPVLGSAGCGNLPQSALVAFVAAFAIYKHKANIVRLKQGCENKIY